MLNKLHPNSRSAWMLVALTVMMSAGMVALLNMAGAPNSRILFTQFDGNDNEIFVMDANGNIEQLTDNDVDDWAAGWSPNYKQIAYRSMSNGTSRIFVMNADGSQAHAVSPEWLYAGDWGRAGIPSWSPDGDSILFEAVDMTTNYPTFDIFLADMTGNVDVVSDLPVNEWHPQFSPDGNRIALAIETYPNDCYNSCDIFVMDADGSNLVRYTYTDSMDVFPQWSPDGDSIMFHSERSGNSDIFVMNADGSDQTNLTNSPELERVARWSQDGNRIVFRSERDGDSDIFVMNLSNGEITARTDNTLEDRFPDW